MRTWLRRLAGYSRSVPIGRRESAMEPVPYLDAKREHVGRWIAVKDGHVIASEASSRELAYALAKLGPDRARGAVAEFVRPATDAYIVGVG